MRTGKRLEIGRGYGIRNLSAEELTARRNRHLEVLEYRRNRPARISEFRAMEAEARASFQEFTEGRPCIVPPPVQEDGSETVRAVLGTSANLPNVAATEPELRTINGPPETAETVKLRAHLDETREALRTRPTEPDPEATEAPAFTSREDAPEAFQCLRCERSFPSRKALNAHGRAHKGK